MNDFNLLSFILGFVMALIVDLASAYTKPVLDRTFSAMSSRWSTRSTAKRAQREMWIRALAADQELRAVVRYWVLRNWIGAATTMLLALGLAYVATTIEARDRTTLVIKLALVISALANITATFSLYKSAWRLDRELTDADKLRSTQ